MEDPKGEGISEVGTSSEVLVEEDTTASTIIVDSDLDVDESKDASQLTHEEKYKIITHHLKEVVGADSIQTTLKERDITIYWGTATTGKPHLGYFVPIYKISDFLRAGCHVTILFADLHAYLDNLKSDWTLLRARCEWYELVIKAMLQQIDVPLDKLRFIRGTEFQLSQEYTMDMYKMSALISTEQSKKAGTEVVKQTDEPLLSSLLYPILQALDEQYLNVDVQFGGVDQRKIFMFARTHLPRIGYKKRSHLMNPLIPGLGKSGKMSSSEPLSKIDLDDTDKTIKDKIMSAYSVDGQPEGNGLLAIMKHILFRYLKKHNKPFIAPRPNKWGGPQTFNNYAEVEAAFSLPDGPSTLKSEDLKKGMITLLIEFLKPLRELLDSNWTLCERAYPGTSKRALSQTKNKPEALTPAALDVRVGKMISVNRVEGADKLYVEQIDVGEPTPRTIVSGLVPYYTVDELQDRLVLVVCNLKPSTLQGVESQGMVLAASSKVKENPQVELVSVPADAKVGERVTFEGCEDIKPDHPFISANRKKGVLKGLYVDEAGCATHKGKTFNTSAGPCKSTIIGGYIM